MIVIDASAVIELLFATDAGLRLGKRLTAEHQALHAPHLLDLEVAQALRRYCRQGELQPRQAAEILAMIGDMPLVRHPHAPLIPRIWELRDSVSAYDAAYIALAESLDARLITRDARLARTTGHTAHVELLQDLRTD